MKKYSFFLALLLGASQMFAQGEYIIELEPSTGVMTKIGGPIPGIHWVYPNIRAYDEVNSRLIFQGGDPLPDHLYSMDVTNGNVVTNPLFPTTGSLSSVSEPQFDNTTQTLYGMHYNTTLSAFFLVTIDPATGLHTEVGTTPVAGLTGIGQGMDTYDEINQRYFIFSSTELFVIDAQTGVLINSAQLSVQPGDAVLQMCYNNANDTLYGLMREGSSQLYFPVWIDPATGVITLIGSGTALAASDGSATIDQANRRLIFTYSDLSNYYLSVMSLVDGSMVYNNQITTLDVNDNVLNIKYDNVQQKLFGIHWDDYIPSLKIHLLTFGAELKDKETATVSWKAVDCTGDEQFNVEHSRDGRTFSTISSFNSQKGKEAYAIDHEISEGYNYYRLRTVELSGHTTYSKVVRLASPGYTTELQLIPNVVSNSASLNVTSGIDEKMDIVIYDISGREVYRDSYQLQKGANTIILDLSGLAQGMYTLKAKLKDETVAPQKFVKL